MSNFTTVGTIFWKASQPCALQFVWYTNVKCLSNVFGMSICISLSTLHFSKKSARKRNKKWLYVIWVSAQWWADWTLHRWQKNGKVKIFKGAYSEYFNYEKDIFRAMLVWPWTSAWMALGRAPPEGRRSRRVEPARKMDLSSLWAIGMASHRTALGTLSTLKMETLAVFDLWQSHGSRLHECVRVCITLYTMLRRRTWRKMNWNFRSEAFSIFSILWALVSPLRRGCQYSTPCPAVSNVFTTAYVESKDCSRILYDLSAGSEVRLLNQSGEHFTVINVDSRAESNYWGNDPMEDRGEHGL